MRWYVTFTLGGALKGYYAEFTSDTHSCPHALEEDVRKYCHAHFPKDWAGCYSVEEFDGQVERHRLSKLGTYVWADSSGFYMKVCMACGSNDEEHVCPVRG
jgi:hypothetical protein